MKEPLVSVIVPVYNVEKYLRQCLNSIVNQTYQNLEIILIDDGSPDDSGMICDEYAAKDERIRVFHQKNAGLSAARNSGLNTMSGEYVIFVDSDDWIVPHAVERMLTVFNSTDADLLIYNFKMVYEEGNTNPHRSNSPIKDEILTRSQLLEKLMEPGEWYFCIACNKLYKKEIFRELRFPVGYIHEDEAIMHRVISECKKITTLSEALYCYRQVPGSIMGKGRTIRSTDKLTALADRICFAYKNGWLEYGDWTAYRYSHFFLELYFAFQKDDTNEKYFYRMKKSLRIALAYILRARRVPIAHKVYLPLILVSPKLCLWFIKVKNRLKAKS